jgi:glycosyltransferase involved in cell wall biosynthesis
MPLATAIVCTRNREASIGAVVESLLAGDDPIELIVVDQSDGFETSHVVAKFEHDQRLRYIRSSERGKGKALNEGIRAARSSIIVCTDDDCIVAEHWVAGMADILERQPKTAVLFCNVVPVPHDASAGYVPDYIRRSDRLVRSMRQVGNGLGLGAGMALRRDVVLDLGGFDEAFGPGGRYPSADEWDIAIRALLAGWNIYETVELQVVHDGFRTNAEGRVHAKRDWLALGAVCAKPIRAGHLSAAVVPLVFFPRRALLPPLLDLLHLRRPHGMIRVSGFARGFLDGMRTPVDRSTIVFRSAPAPG